MPHQGDASLALPPPPSIFSFPLFQPRSSTRAIRQARRERVTSGSPLPFRLIGGFPGGAFDDRPSAHTYAHARRPPLFRKAVQGPQVTGHALGPHVSPADVTDSAPSFAKKAKAKAISSPLPPPPSPERPRPPSLSGIPLPACPDSGSKGLSISLYSCAAAAAAAAALQRTASLVPRVSIKPSNLSM